MILRQSVRQTSARVGMYETKSLCAWTLRTVGNLPSLNENEMCYFFFSQATLHYMSSRQYCFIDRVPYEERRCVT